MKFISFVSAIAIFCLISLCLATERKTKKLKTKTKVDPQTYKKINNGWLAQCGECAQNLGSTKVLFKCPHTSVETQADCVDCTPKNSSPQINCTGCFGVKGATAGCFIDKILNIQNHVQIVNPEKKVDMTQFTIVPKPGTVLPPMLQEENKQVVPQVLPQVVIPVVNPDTMIVNTLGVTSAFLIFDATGSMLVKRSKLVEEVNKLLQTAKVTYCYQTGKKIVTKELQIGNLLAITDLDFKSDQVKFKACLEKFKSDIEPYNAIYIIGDGEFDTSLNKISISTFFTLKEPIKKEATLLYPKGTTPNKNFETKVAEAAFNLIKIEV